ncbi:FkbM family methyltransferase [Cellulomonas chengniuliangii]|uniref:FkbM family methyltransferase n=1 Tax=Cellulomonas chengniuliangii TaxID=2968084 RepID=A0ABY5L2G8_9CELL|nr:FkbM family methyltransferase [Cellulomonas chengniuliangii]UUI77011.1 FkbM family methyltransferase [Cellulomonas chengniuliangii]
MGANHPRVDSISRAFYDRGWSGITIEPVPHFADLHREERPRDRFVEAAVSSTPEAHIQLHMVKGTGLSTVVDAVSSEHARAGIAHEDITVPVVRLDDLLDDAGWQGEDIHFVVIDVEGAERSALETIDLRKWRPWILVIESTAPNSTTPTHDEWEELVVDAGYEFCLFDGVSRFYLAQEHAAQLRAALSYPVCAHDEFVRAHDLALKAEREALLDQVVHWRTTALAGWAEIAAKTEPDVDPALEQEVERLRAELAAMHETLSWKVTGGLRLARRAMGAARRSR